MKHRQKGRGWTITEILMSLLVTISGIILVLDWEEHEYLFAVAFAAAAMLFISRGMYLISVERGHVFTGVLYLIGAVLMVGFLTGSILTIWGGNL